MRISYNSPLVDVTEAIAGDWGVKKSQKSTVFEIAGLKIVRQRVAKGSNTLSVVPTEETPYNLYFSDGITGGVILSGQMAVSVDRPGILTYFVYTGGENGSR